MKSSEFKESSKAIKLSYVIVGASAAGVSTAKELRKRDEVATITLISEENIIPYYRTRLSKSLSNPQRDRFFFLNPEEWYQKNNIKLLLNTKVTKINREEKYITTNEYSTLHYDKLILATGSDSYIPPIDNISLPGVFKLRDINDLDKIYKYIPQSKKVLVIGGGILGIENAFELLKLNLEVSIFENQSHILHRMVGHRGSEIIEAQLQAFGINTIIGEQIDTIIGTRSVEGIKLKNGKIIPFDMIIVSAGIKPNIELAKNSSLKTNRGIIVNNSLQTSDENIYAVGDVAEYNNIINGTWTKATKQGVIAASNICGDSKNYVDKSSSISLITKELFIFSIGVIDENAVNVTEIYSYEKPTSHCYVKLYFNESTLIGAILINQKAKMTTVLQNFEKTILDKELLINSIMGD